LYIRIYDIARPRAQGLNAFMPPPFCGIERHAGRRCQARRPWAINRLGGPSRAMDGAGEPTGMYLRRVPRAY
jgi:hypothetical protein